MSKPIDEILAPKPEARPRIYAYSIADKPHAGLLKIGQTTREVRQRIAEQLEAGKLLEAETGDLDPVDGLDETVIIDHHAAEEGQLRLPDKRGARQQEKGSFREDRPFEAAQVAFLHKTAHQPLAVFQAVRRGAGARKRNAHQKHYQEIEKTCHSRFSTFS